MLQQFLGIEIADRRNECAGVQVCQVWRQCEHLGPPVWGQIITMFGELKKPPGQIGVHRLSYLLDGFQ